MSIQEKLLKIQEDSIKLKKDANNPFFWKPYISLDNIIETYSVILTKQKIVCYHYTIDNKLTTILFDTESNTEVKSEFNVLNTDPQKAGSEITYWKRYNLWQLLNIQTDTDDDWNKASSWGNTKQYYKEDKKEEPKKWYNSFEKQKADMIKKIESWESTPESIIKAIEKAGFTINNKVKGEINNLTNK